MLKPVEQVLLPTQMAVWRDKSPVVCYIGGIGTGKSHLLSMYAARESLQYKNNLGIIAAATAPQLKLSTIPTCRKVWDSVGLWYSYKEYKATVEFANGSWLKFQSLDIPAGELKGSELGWLAIDEVDTCGEEHVERLWGRVRRTGASRTQRYFGNSPPPMHWVEKWFAPTEIGRRPMGKLYQAATYENKFLPDDYIAGLELKHPPGTPGHDRFLMGKLGVALEGAIYFEFDPKTHLIRRDQVPEDACLFAYGLDLGHHHPTVFLVGALSTDDTLYIVAEHCSSTMLLKDHAERIKALYRGGPIFSDHDAQDRFELQALGVTTVPANKDVAEGIQNVKTRLRSGKLKIVGDACPRLVSELPFYRWGKDEMPVKINDDACFTAATEVLTKQGWKSLADVQEGDFVLAVDTVGNAAFERPLRVIHREYSGKMYEISHSHLAFTATDDHSHAVMRQIDWKVRGNWRLTKKRVSELPSESYWATNLPQWKAGRGLFEGGALEAWMAGFWLAEGCFDHSRPSFILFDQKKAEHQTSFRRGAKALGWVWSETHSATNAGMIRFVVSGQKTRAEQWFRWFGEHSWQKRLSPHLLFKMSVEERKSLWEGYMAGDGCRTKASGWHFDTVSEHLANGMQLLTLMLGYGCVLHSYCEAGSRVIQGRKCRCRKTFRGYVQLRESVAHINKGRFAQTLAEKLPVHCVETSTGMFFARTFGKPFVAGNCDSLRYLVNGLDSVSNADGDIIAALRENV